MKERGESVGWYIIIYRKKGCDVRYSFMVLVKWWLGCLKREREEDRAHLSPLSRAFWSDGSRTSSVMANVIEEEE